VFGSAVRGDFPPVADSGPSAALRDRGRIGSGGGFAVGPSTALRTGFVPDGVSRGHSGRCARCRPVVRFLHRGVFREVVEDRADGGGFFDAGHDP